MFFSDEHDTAGEREKQRAMSDNGILIPQLLILCIGIFCATVALYCFPSPQSWSVLGLILIAIAIAIIASVAFEVLP